MDVRQLAERLDVPYQDVNSMTAAQIDWSTAVEEISRLSYTTRLAFAIAVAAASAQGECRVIGLNDIAQVFPVLDPNGLHWECNHPSKQHKSRTVMPLRP